MISPPIWHRNSQNLAQPFNRYLSIVIHWVPLSNRTEISHFSYLLTGCWIRMKRHTKAPSKSTIAIPFLHLFYTLSFLLIYFILDAQGPTLNGKERAVLHGHGTNQADKCGPKGNKSTIECGVSRSITHIQPNLFGYPEFDLGHRPVFHSATIAQPCGHPETDLGHYPVFYSATIRLSGNWLCGKRLEHYNHIAGKQQSQHPNANLGKIQNLLSERARYKAPSTIKPRYAAHKLKRQYWEKKQQTYENKIKDY